VKRILLLAIVLSIPALAHAQPDIQSETWTAFCDNGVEKVRSSFVLHLCCDPLIFDDGPGEVGASSYCDPDNSCSPIDGLVRPLGNDLYSFDFDWRRDCFQNEAWRGGRLWWRVVWGDDHALIWIDLGGCEDGPQPIIDNVDCAPVPVASKTWGAIKAMYRP
jgi:hypothetical protein